MGFPWMDNYHIVKDGENMNNRTGSVKIHIENGQLQKERTYQLKDDQKN